MLTFISALDNITAPVLGEGLAHFILQAVHIGRTPTARAAADAVIFLHRPRSSYITGCGFIVDGGTTLTALRWMQ